MLLVSLTAGSRTAQGVAEAGAFAVHLLPHAGRKYAEQFASRSLHFHDVKYTTTLDSHIPVLAEVLGWFLCRVEHTVAVADHMIFVGRVLQCELKDRSPDPLLYFDRSYRKLAPGTGRSEEDLEPWGTAGDAGLPGFGW
jgi:flavin reductase (DIM6/NTAB) family NADH-FMN oxidoreductase RutF